ncbi:hypothetical protein GOQ27_15960 [Clostridium sp. D2Q-11]|uniref:UDP-N-acetylmuramyl pentapeptide phosphotransferase/UDP-N-acetylglucosamine-1-phosphate transferase n=1 Tax=Anaeromonas frigoriresistens TaxID=2683708 RepID=A0A942V500_9FIRM|nr:hypothetical protein [Anaeromonas frigoriresistens]MBS4539972.1 hypothetical protein [Anaeromonas frigoriresistens]
MLEIYLFLLSYIINLVLCDKILHLIYESQHIQINYLGLSIPNSMGLSISITQLILAPIVLIYYNDYNVFMIILIGELVAFMGIIDDFFGNSSKGFKGHVMELINGRLTSGILKIIIGSLSSLFTAYILYTNLYIFVLDSLIIVLSINTLNLFDMRPGRVMKIFYISLGIILIFTAYNRYDLLSIIIIGSSLAYFPIDIKGRAMLGDIGSNVLGYYLGVSIVTNDINKPIILLILLVINLISEKVSLSKIISNNKILNYFDYLGRKI